MNQLTWAYQWVRYNNETGSLKKLVETYQTEKQKRICKGISKNYRKIWNHLSTHNFNYRKNAAHDIFEGTVDMGGHSLNSMVDTNYIYKNVRKHKLWKTAPKSTHGHITMKPEEKRKKNKISEKND